MDSAKAPSHEICLFALTAIACIGCWRTVPVSMANGQEGVGYGTEIHHNYAWGTTVYSTGRVAYSDGPRDAYWRSYGSGGSRLQYCERGPNGPRCTDAVFPENPGRLLTVVDPVNLGLALREERSSGVDGTQWVSVRGHAIHANVQARRVTPWLGVWVVALRSSRGPVPYGGGLHYCHVGGGAPACTYVGQGQALGTVVREKPEPAHVLWYGERGQIRRCTVTAPDLTPRCVDAAMPTP